jgi:hypothetical protein
MSTLYVDNLQPNLNSQVSIPNLQPIAGQVIQVITHSPSIGVTAVTSNSFTELNATLRASITPKSASSMLLLTCTFLYGGRNSSNISHFKFYDITNSTDVNPHSGDGSRIPVHGSSRQNDTDANDVDVISMSARVAAGSTNARTYSIYTSTESTQAAITKYFFGGPTDSAAIGIARPIFVIQEIAQ